MTKLLVLAATAAAMAAICRAESCATAEDDASASGENDWSRIFLASVPSISPDGDFFVFEWCGSIWRANTSGGEATRLTKDESREYWPILSPDGTRVAFLSNRDGGRKIFEMDLATRKTRQVTRLDGFVCLNGWMPDGKTIVAGAQRGLGRKGKTLRIVAVSPDGRETLPFERVNSYVAAASPDGRIIAFAYRGENIYRKRRTGKASVDSEIWLYDTQTRKFERAATLSDNAMSPVWRPDGKAFYYLGRKSGASVAGVREYTLEGRRDREVVSFGDDAAVQPTLSADGKTMIVRARFDFWRFDPTAANPRPQRIHLVPGGEPNRLDGTFRRFYSQIWNNDYPGDLTFCADGTQFAFTCGGGLYAMDSIAEMPRLVADAAPRGRAVECAFTPDGSRLYALFDFGDSTEIRYFTRKDASLAWWENTSFDSKTIASGEQKREGLTASPDGTRIAWSDASCRLYFADLEGVVTGSGPVVSGVGSYAWSPDARHVIASLPDDNGNYDIWLVSTDGSAEPFNITRSWRWEGSCAWSPDGKVIAWSGYEPEANNATLHYAYLDPADEASDRIPDKFDRSRKANAKSFPAKEKAEGKKSDAGKKDSGKDEKPEEKKPPYNIVLDGIRNRIRHINVPASALFFGPDSRTIAYDTGAATDKVKITGERKAERLSARRGRNAVWFKADNRVAWCVNGCPAHLDKSFKVAIYREDDVAGYRALAFRSAWARIRDVFYDPARHGADWEAVRAKYLEPARNAASFSVFERVISMMLGELDASHLGFYPDGAAAREWVREGTLHNWPQECGCIGVEFEPGTFKISSVMRNSPADGVLSPGDVITAVDGRPLEPGENFAERLIVPDNTPGVQIAIAPRKEGDAAPAPVYIKPVSSARLRELSHEEAIRTTRERVHKESGGRTGYVYISAMLDDDYKRFEAEVYDEIYGRDALIVDVRGNSGGYIADRLLAVLCQARHAYAVFRNGQTGYPIGPRTRPFFNGRVVVLIDEESFSNAEIFSHAIKTLGRGVLVGRRTAGAVIGTSDGPLLDYGKFRDARIGWFLPDGADMENNGAIPDIPVDITPAEEEAGRDTQLEAAMRAASSGPSATAFTPKYAK